MLPRTVGSLVKTPEKTGLIFDIQKYSIHDGPGIRTLVFFKGCPLRCLWCSNPEGQKIYHELMWMEQHCIHCSKCLDICPEGAITETREEKKIIDRNRCSGCGICDENCYANAMQLAGRYVSVDEILKDPEKLKNQQSNLINGPWKTCGIDHYKRPCGN